MPSCFRGETFIPGLTGFTTALASTTTSQCQAAILLVPLAHLNTHVTSVLLLPQLSLAPHLLPGLQRSLLASSCSVKFTCRTKYRNQVQHLEPPDTAKPHGVVQYDDETLNCSEGSRALCLLGRFLSTRYHTSSHGDPRNIFSCHASTPAPLHISSLTPKSRYRMGHSRHLGMSVVGHAICRPCACEQSSLFSTAFWFSLAHHHHTMCRCRLRLLSRSDRTAWAAGHKSQPSLQHARPVYSLSAVSLFQRKVVAVHLFTGLHCCQESGSVRCYDRRTNRFREFNSDGCLRRHGAFFASERLYLWLGQCHIWDFPSWLRMVSLQCHYSYLLRFGIAILFREL